MKYLSCIFFLSLLIFTSCKEKGHCNNGLQDGEETGIDCGGNCATCPDTVDEPRELTDTERLLVGQWKLESYWQIEIPKEDPSESNSFLYNDSIFTRGYIPISSDTLTLHFTDVYDHWGQFKCSNLYKLTECGFYYSEDELDHDLNYSADGSDLTIAGWKYDILELTDNKLLIRSKNHYYNKHQYLLSKTGNELTDNRDARLFGNWKVDSIVRVNEVLYPYGSSVVKFWSDSSYVGRNFRECHLLFPVVKTGTFKGYRKGESPGDDIHLEIDPFDQLFSTQTISYWVTHENYVYIGSKIRAYKFELYGDNTRLKITGKKEITYYSKE